MFLMSAQTIYDEKFILAFLVYKNLQTKYEAKIKL